MRGDAKSDGGHGVSLDQLGNRTSICERVIYPCGPIVASALSMCGARGRYGGGDVGYKCVCVCVCAFIAALLAMGLGVCCRQPVSGLWCGFSYVLSLSHICCQRSSRLAAGNASYLSCPCRRSMSTPKKHPL
jgi:hypothetical protein